MGLIASGKARDDTLTATSLTLSWTITGTYGKKLVVLVVAGVGATQDCTGITYGGVPLTRVTGAKASATNGTGNFETSDAFFLDEKDYPAAGAQNLIATWDAAGSHLTLFVGEFDFAAQGQPNAAAQNGIQGLFTVISATITTTDPNSRILSACSCNANRATCALGGGQASIQNYLGVAGSALFTSEALVAAGADVQSFTWPSNVARSVITSVAVVAGFPPLDRVQVRPSQAVQRASTY